MPNAARAIAWHFELSRAYQTLDGAKYRFSLREFLVRGLAKVTCVALLGALTSNLLAHGQNFLS